MNQLSIPIIKQVQQHVIILICVISLHQCTHCHLFQPRLYFTCNKIIFLTWQPQNFPHTCFSAITNSLPPSLLHHILRCQYTTPHKIWINPQSSINRISISIISSFHKHSQIEGLHYSLNAMLVYPALIN